MKVLAMIVAVLVCRSAMADEVFECESSAVHYITTIANAPYPDSDNPLSDRDLILVSKKSMGDGSESYEKLVYKTKRSEQKFLLTLYVQEIGGICPLEKFEVR